MRYKMVIECISRLRFVQTPLVWSIAFSFRSTFSGVIAFGGTIGSFRICNQPRKGYYYLVFLKIFRYSTQL